MNAKVGGSGIACRMAGLMTMWSPSRTPVCRCRRGWRRSLEVGFALEGEIENAVRRYVQHRPAAAQHMFDDGFGRIARADQPGDGVTGLFELVGDHVAAGLRAGQAVEAEAPVTVVRVADDECSAFARCGGLAARIVLLDELAQDAEAHRRWRLPSSSAS